MIAIAVSLVIIITLFILLLYITRLDEVFRDKLNKQTCKSSIRLQDFTQIKDITLPVDIKCPMQRIEINEKDTEKIKKEIADIYYNVCDEFGQGTLNLFGNREQTYCVIRDKISFKNKGIAINDFGKYLATSSNQQKKCPMN